MLSLRGDDSAAYKGCPKFVESQHIQEIKVREQMSYSQAVLKIQSQSITTQNSEVISPKSLITQIDHNQPRRIDPEPSQEPEKSQQNFEVQSSGPVSQLDSTN